VYARKGEEVEEDEENKDDENEVEKEEDATQGCVTDAT